MIVFGFNISFWGGVIYGYNISYVRIWVFFSKNGSEFIFFLYNIEFLICCEICIIKLFVYFF